MTRHTRQSGSETGAVLVHAALVLIGLMAMSTFVVDYGVLWSARRQAQNAADSGALAGAVHMLYDTNLTPNAAVLSTAQSVALANNVWAQAPWVDTSFECPPYVTAGSPVDCIRVDVYRDQAHDNPLPMIFGAFLGRNTQGIRATATARVANGNASNCMKPWALADWFTEVVAPLDEFNSGDVYVPPTSSSPGTGYSFAADYGTAMMLKAGSPGDSPSPGWFRAIDYPVGANGATGYRHDIAHCVGATYGIGDSLPPENGNMVGPTNQGVGDLIARDPFATWTSGGIQNSCVTTRTCLNEAGNVDPSISMSPRLVAVPLYDPAVFDSTGVIKIVNILGFFVTGSGSGEVHGILASVPSLVMSGSGTVGSTFAKAITLIR